MRGIWTVIVVLGAVAGVLADAQVDAKAREAEAKAEAQQAAAEAQQAVAGVAIRIMPALPADDDDEDAGPAAARNAEAQFKANLAQQKKQVTSCRLAGSYKLADVIKLRLVQGRLTLECPTDIGQDNQMVRIEITDAPGIWTVTRHRMGAQQKTMSLQRHEFAADFMETASISNQGSGAVHISAVNRTPKGNTNISLSQTGAAIRLTVNTWRTDGLGVANRQGINSSFKSIPEMLSQKPAEVRTYVQPLLRTFASANLLQPGPADVYGAFESLQPEPATMEKVKALVARLDEAAFADREAAMNELAGLGRPGILAALRLDLATLSPEQVSRVREFLDGHRRWANTAEDARKDVYFTVDCLEDEDQTVRQAAIERLKTLTSVPVEIDPALSGEKLTAAVDKIRTDVAKAIAATRPAQPAKPPRAPADNVRIQPFER